MGKDISFKNHDRFIHLGIAIAALRKMRGMSQEQLAVTSIWSARTTGYAAPAISCATNAV